MFKRKSSQNNTGRAVVVLLKPFSAVYHPGYKPRIPAGISQDNPCKMQQDKTIDAILGKAVQLFQRPADGLEKCHIFKCQSETSHRHHPDKKIKKNITPFHTDIMFLCPSRFRQQGTKTHYSFDPRTQLLIRWLKYFQYNSAQQECSNEIAYPGMQLPYLITECMRYDTGLFLADGQSVLLQLFPHKRCIVSGAKDRRRQ